ncbi:MAG: hypothetical protein CVT49_06925 [candidate division Zixibacteria bacterium HGW-Zixibacteria-1]|nr:MAG: hypothetical protein CVT49_06925 [candidate division Zixibacteria bacterium HGW-Zixibacteria-1]
MKLRNLLLAALILSLVGFLAGCGEDSTSPSDDDLLTIADEFGGYTPTDEQAAFGDPVLLDDMDADKIYDDELLASPAVDSIIDESIAGAYALRIVWGSLRYDSTITEITDWSGSLTVSRGAEIVRRTIRFEDGQDYILDRTDRTLIEWVSLTTVHFDGIFVNIYIPPVVTDDSAMIAEEPVTVTFETGPLMVSFSTDQLPALDTVFYLEDSVNAVAFHGFKVEPMGCPNGFLDGRWGTDTTGLGVFNGRWIASNGMLAGYIHGEWGQDSAGANYFVGKYIDINGQFEGLLKGTYRWMPFGNMNGLQNGRVPCHGGGKFYGHFYDAERNPIGVLKGRFRLPKDNTDGDMGYFFGRWKKFCSSVATVNDGMEEQ